MMAAMQPQHYSIDVECVATGTGVRGCCAAEQMLSKEATSSLFFGLGCYVLAGAAN